MTILIINGVEKHEILTQENQTIYDILMAAQDKYWTSSSTINSLLVDGEKLEPLEEATLKNLSATNRRIEIEIKEESPRSIGETLAEARIYLDRLEKGFEEISSQIRIKGDSNSYVMLRDGLEGLSQIVELFGAIRGSITLPEDLISEFSTFIGSLNEKCEEMTDAQTNQDPTLIADILEYEFIETVGELRGFLDRIIEMTP